MEKQFNEQESLRIIQEMIAKSKTNLGESSYFYLLWGWLVFISSLSHFILLSVSYKQPYILWPIAMTLGAILSVIKSRKLHKESKTKTYIETAIIHLWIGFSISMFIVLFSAAFGKINWVTSNSFIIVLYGLATYVSGGILKFNPLKAGGIASWIIAVVSLFLPGQYSMLAIAISIVVAYLWPGYLLRSKEKAQSHV